MWSSRGRCGLVRVRIIVFALNLVELMSSVETDNTINYQINASRIYFQSNPGTLITSLVMIDSCGVQGAAEAWQGSELFLFA